MIFMGKAGGFAAEFAKAIGDILGIEFVPINFEVAKDLAYWSAEVPGKVVARAEALTGPMTPPGKRVQTLNPPGARLARAQLLLGAGLWLTKWLLWVSNGIGKRGQASTFHLSGPVPDSHEKVGERDGVTRMANFCLLLIDGIKKR